MQQPNQEEVKKYEQILQNLKDLFDTGTAGINATYKGSSNVILHIGQETEELYTLTLFVGKRQFILCKKLNLQLITYYIMNSDFKDVVFDLPYSFTRNREQ